MTTNLADRSLDLPLPTGLSYRKFGGGSAGSVAWPPAENFLYPGTGPGGDTMFFRRPERFWLRAGGNCIAYSTSGSWNRYDYELRLCVSTGSNYANDLNGINFFQKAQAFGGGTDWWGTSIEGLWFCEANTDYAVYFLSKGGNASGNYYYQAQGHYNLWAYTIGEGVY